MQRSYHMQGVSTLSEWDSKGLMTSQGMQVKVMLIYAECRHAQSEDRMKQLT